MDKPVMSATLEIESASDTPLDLDAIRACLRERGVKLTASAPGHRLLGLGGIKRAHEDLGMALRVAGVLPYSEPRTRRSKK